MGTHEKSEPLAYSVPDACAALGISRPTLYREIGAGRLAVRKLGKRTLIERTEALRWLGSLPVQAGVVAH